MRVDDYFRDRIASGGVGRPVLRVELLRALRQGPVAPYLDAEAGLALVQLARQQFMSYGTDGGHSITDAGSREVIRTLNVLADRLRISDFNLPFTDFSSFRAYWTQNEGYGSWAARRAMVVQFFEPLQQELERLEDSQLSADLVSPIATQELGWPDVDEELRELRRHFHAAHSIQDYRNVGNDCIATLEALSAVVYSPAQHLRSGETEPPVSNTKQRLERFADDALPGAGNAELRGLVKKTIEFAQAVKHNAEGTRAGAGIAADSVIQLANILRRIHS